MFNFGTTQVKIKEVNELDTEMVLTMVANPEMKGSRKFIFSLLAYSTLDFNSNMSPLNEKPFTVNEVISFGNVTNALGEIQNYSFFVNNAEIGGLPEINVGKTTLGFNDSKIYKKLAEMYNLDTSIDNVFNIVRSTTEDEVETANGIEIYNIFPRVIEEPQTTEEGNAVSETTGQELEDVELDNNSDVNVTLD
jgi:hypothetical protein